MDLTAALELLAIDRDEPLTADRVRRAYLRQLRRFPPERDPEGFQRLREALAIVEVLAAADAPARPPEGPSGPPPALAPRPVEVRPPEPPSEAAVDRVDPVDRAQPAATREATAAPRTPRSAFASPTTSTASSRST
jgi:hypothetical protein